MDPSIAPDHETGASSDTTHEITAPDEMAARRVFQQAMKRLLDVNRWHELAGSGSAVFHLADENGNGVDRPARLGDHFRIDIPGPGNPTGEGSDWVQVEAVSHTVHDETETIALRVRPADNPRSRKTDVAHFFSDEASSTFSVTRAGNKVVASVQGRNEKPNIKAKGLTGKLRNTLVAAGAMLGLNKPQWKGLVKGLLD